VGPIEVKSTPRPPSLANSYTARSDAYLYLLTETYPPFQDEETRSAGLAPVA